MIEAITGSRLRRTLSLFVASRIFVPREGEGNKGGESKGLTDDQVRRIIAEEGHGDSRKAIRVIVRDRTRASERARKAEEKWTDAEKAGRIAPEKEFVILTGDDAKVWPDVAKFVSESKLTLPKLLELAKKVPELEGQVAAQALATQRADAAKALNWNDKALAEILETKGLEIAERDIVVEDDEGKKTKQPVWSVRKTGAKDDEWEPLAEYAESKLHVLLPALLDVEGGADNEDGGERRAPVERRRQGASQPAAGTTWPEQSRSRTPSGKQTPEDESKIRERAATSGIYSPL